MRLGIVLLVLGFGMIIFSRFFVIKYKLIYVLKMWIVVVRFVKVVLEDYMNLIKIGFSFYLIIF